MITVVLVTHAAYYQWAEQAQDSVAWEPLVSRLVVMDRDGWYDGRLHPKAGLIDASKLSVQESRWVGIQLADTEFVVLLDGDDWFQSGSLQLMRDTFRRHQACDRLAWVYPAAYYWFPERKPLYVAPVRRGDILECNQMVLSSLFLRKALNGCGGFPEVECYMDWAIYLALHGRGWHGVPCDAATLNVRRHGNNLTHRRPLDRDSWKAEHGALFGLASQDKYSQTIAHECSADDSSGNQESPA